MFTPGHIINKPKAIIAINTASPVAKLIDFLSCFAHFMVAIATNPYKKIAIIVVTSTIHPIAERPRRDRRYPGDLRKRQTIGCISWLKSHGAGQEIDYADDKTSGDTDNKDGDK